MTSSGEQERPWSPLAEPLLQSRDDWQDAVRCSICNTALGKRVMNPRHHCRFCGNAVCGKCSSHKLQGEGQSGWHRACETCAGERSAPPRNSVDFHEARARPESDSVGTPCVSAENSVVTPGGAAAAAAAATAAAPAPAVAAAATVDIKDVQGRHEAGVQEQIYRQVSDSSATETIRTSFEAGTDEVEDVQEIKATTMHNMVEEITDREGVRRKVVFLTNAQAKIIVQSPERVKRLVDALEMPEPKLLINLIPSFDGTELIADGSFFHAPSVPGLESIRTSGKHVFTWASRKEYDQAERNLSAFMKDVLIPLAVETNAVVLCDASYKHCILATVFGRMIQLARAKWGVKPPFTIIGVCSAMRLLYNNYPGETWNHLRRKCKHWRQRHNLIERLVRKEAKDDGRGFSTDLDANVTAYLLFDSIDEHKKGREGSKKEGSIGDQGPGNLLVAAIIDYFKDRIPCTAIKTGMSRKEKSGERYQSGLSVVVDSLAACIPVVVLDLRPRHLGDELQSSKAAAVQQARDCFIETCDNIKEFPDILDLCALSFFHSVLEGSVNLEDGSDKHGKFIPLHEAIEKVETQRQGKAAPKHSSNTNEPPKRALKKFGSFRRSQDRDPTTSVDIVEAYDTKAALDEVLQFLAREIYSRAWNFLPDRTKQDHPDYEEFYGVYIHNWLQQSKFIMTNENLYSLNVENIEVAKRSLHHLVKLDRLPAQNSLEGLRLLRRLWDHHDICAFHADRYKIISKVTYFLQLSFQIALVVCGVFIRNEANNGGAVERYRGYAPFLISTIASVMMTINAVINPMKRWRQLRASALSLESIAWKYRTRVDEYAVNPHAHSSPERALTTTLRSWLKDVVSGTDLDTSDLGRKNYPESVYKHLQYEPQNGFHGGYQIFNGVNDFQSPAKPEAFIELRIKPAKEFYSGRIAPYSWWRYWWIILGLACTVCSSFLAYVGYVSYLGIPSATANAILAWSEFADVNRKIERYNNVVRKLEDLLVWWDGISEVEKASSANIRKLVLNAESLIAGEYQAWQSISSSSNKDDMDVSLDAYTADYGSANKADSIVDGP